MDERSNRLEDLLTEKELNLYHSCEYPFNLSILHAALKTKLKEDPSYEVWVPFVYYPYRKGGVIKPYKAFISNKGVVWSFKKNKNTGRQLPPSDEEYPRVTIDGGKSRYKLGVHRALACSFIPMDYYLLANEDALSPHPQDLQVNHIDGVKTNYELGNLEWTTGSGNMLHAVSAGLYVSPSGLDRTSVKSLTGEILSGTFKGYRFLLHGKKQVETNGFDSAHARSVAAGKVDSHRNCKFSFSTDEELNNLSQGLPEEIKASLTNLNPYTSTKVIARHIETEEQIIIVGLKAMKALKFHDRLVLDVIAGRRPHYKGYTFERVPI